MSDLTPEEVAFAAELLWGHEYPDISTDEQDKGIWAMNLQADAKHKARGWLLFGRVVEAMLRQGWQVRMRKSDPAAHRWVVFFKRKHPVMDKPNLGRGDDAHNPAVAAIKAARAALGDHDGA